VNVTFLTPTRLWLLLQGHPGLLELTEKAQWLVVSVINILEFLGFDGLSDSDRDLFAKFVSRVSVVDLVSGNGALMAVIADLRKRKAVKLPDAIVVASAALHRATLLTNDTQLLKLAGRRTGLPCGSVLADCLTLGVGISDDGQALYQTTLHLDASR